jgi:hypothetical protein
MACYRNKMCFAFIYWKLTKTSLRHFGTAATICRQNKTISACGDVGLNRLHAIMGTYKRPCGDVGGDGKVQVVVLEECFRIWFGGGVLALRCGFVLVVGGCVVTSFCIYLDLLVTGLLSHWHLPISLFISIHATTSYFACFSFLMYILNENQVRKAISLNNNERENNNNLNINVQK